MKLNPHEMGSPLWQKLEDHYCPILAKLRARIENPDLEESARIPLLWQAHTIKQFLALGDPEPKGSDARD